MQKKLLLLAILMVVFTFQVFPQDTVQFSVPFIFSISDVPGKAETLYVGVSGDSAGPMLDNTYLFDVATTFGPYGAYREAQYPGDPPPPFEVYTKLTDIPGRGGMGMLRPWDFRGFTDTNQVDTFQIRMNGDGASGSLFAGCVAASAITITWGSNIDNYAHNWELKKRVGVSYTSVVADMAAGTSWVDSNANQDDMVRYLIILTGPKMPPITGIKSYNIDQPTTFELTQNYPNPFNPTTEINFTVAKKGRTQLVMYNTLGQEVMRLFDGIAEPNNRYQVTVDGSRLASGVYFYRLTGVNTSDIKKMVLMK